MLNGSLKSLHLLWVNLASNRRYQSFVEKADIKVFTSRLGNEGLPFLTKVLPLLGRALDTFHSTNKWEAPESFKTDSDGIPRFLGKAIRFAIDGNSVAVDCVRQLSYVFYKLEVPYEKDEITHFLDQFVRTDLDLCDIDYGCALGTTARKDPGGDPENFKRQTLINVMRGLVHKILRNVDPLDIRPCHGSGATACRTPNSDKWHKLRYYPKLDQTFDYSTYFFFSATHVADDLEHLETSSLSEPMARVCLVPKDSRGPRVISCEPAELMYIQQGLMRKLYDHLETYYLTRGQINFTDQDVNRDLARAASVNNTLATLDLKDASDRVSLELVRRIFPSDWLECLEACRSENTTLPDGRIVKLAKFAPMGSSCCFPVEALTFWVCAKAAICIASGSLEPKVYVYGDDIICDSSFSTIVMDALESVGLLVNRHKSYVSGPFRESCGGDFHNGYEVTPVRVRKMISDVGTGLASCADLCNEFIAKFGYEDSHSLIRVIEESLEYTFPRTDLEYPLTIRTQPCAANDVLFKRRWNPALQRFEHRILTLRHLVLPKREPNWFELLRKELSREKAGGVTRYENQISVVDAALLPGQYADSHTAHKTWSWVWLG